MRRSRLSDNRIMVCIWHHPKSLEFDSRKTITPLTVWNSFQWKCAHDRLLLPKPQWPFFSTRTTLVQWYDKVSRTPPYPKFPHRYFSADRNAWYRVLTIIEVSNSLPFQEGGEFSGSARIRVRTLLSWYCGPWQASEISPDLESSNDRSIVVWATIQNTKDHVSITLHF